MISYNSKTLDNLEVQEAAEKALRKQCISAEEFQQIKTAYPVDLYSPNPYIRVGLFILTIIITLFSFGLFCLMFMQGGERAIGGLTVFFGLAAFGGIEFMVHEKKHYKSGVDTALMWTSGAAIIGGICVIIRDFPGTLALSLLVLVLATAFVLRFADVVMSIIAFLALLVFVFTALENVSRLVIPFAVMAVSFGVYLAAVKLEKIYTYRHYSTCLQVLQVVSLLTLYLGGNYYVVREMTAYMFYLDLKPGQDIPGALIFWIITVILPPLYIFLGIQKKDRILLRVGLFLIAAIVFTIRNYYAVAPIEVAMTIGGIILIAAAYGVTKFLQPSRNGFTSEETDDDDVTEALQLESLIVAQSFSQTGPQGNQFDFGEGSGSGGGASGNY